MHKNLNMVFLLNNEYLKLTDAPISKEFEWKNFQKFGSNYIFQG